MKKALIVGINHYTHAAPLFGCVNDAYSVKSIIERNDGGGINFDCNILTASGPKDAISRGTLKDAIKELFASQMETVLFYFAGHGYIEEVGGYILASDATRGDDGVALSEILALANMSPATNKIIILDSCHSGYIGTMPAGGSIATLSSGLSILTASTKDQYASEENGNGLFSSLLVDALSGSAANIMGIVTPGSVYAHIDQSLGAWEQRPVFKTNVQRFIALRETTPAIPIEDLLLITSFFPKPGSEFPLDPSYEPEMKGRLKGAPAPDPDNTRKFAILQKYNRLNLVKPVDAPHMWHAAMESKSCKLTAQGEHYRRLVAKGRI